MNTGPRAVRGIAARARWAVLVALAACGALLGCRGVGAPANGASERRPGAVNGPAPEVFASLDRARLRLTRRSGPGCSLSLTLVGIARDDRLFRAKRGSCRVDGQRVECDRGRKTVEWLLRGPLGPEHGFTLGERPKGSGRLALQLAASGPLSPERVNADSVRFVSPQGVPVIGYGDLHAFDASGRSVPADFDVNAGGITIELDDHDAVYPVTVDPLFTVETPIQSPAPVLYSSFGETAWLSGNTLIAGTSSGGHAYIFLDTTNGWVLQQTLTGSDYTTSQFGWGVSVDGNTALVGGYNAPAFVFIRSGTAWTLQQELIASDTIGGAMRPVVALQSDTAVVGSYVFERSNGVWTEQQKLIGNDTVSGDDFGAAVALDVGTIVVGAPSADSGAGAAYVFVQAGSSWAQQAKLVANNAAPQDDFGASVAIFGDTVVVGADGGRASSIDGKAYAFVRSGTSWSEQQALTANDLSAGDQFGSAVAVGQDVAIVGAHAQNNYAGAAYLFQRSGSTWAMTRKILPSDYAQQNSYANAIAIDGTNAVVASSGDSTLDIYAGAVFVYSTPGIGTSCTSSGKCGSGFCVDGVCCASGCTGVCAACSFEKTGQPNGVCAPVKAGTDPDGDCSDDGAPSCGQDGLCDGAFGCQKYAGPGCTPKPCAVATDCTSGHCAKEPGASSGICCDSDCSGPCRSCRAALQGPSGQDGICAPIPSGTDPRQECARDPGYPASCGADGTCDGAGSCRAFALPSVSCGPTTCSAGVVSGSLCDGAGTCTSGSTTPCEPYACNAAGSACLSSCTADLDCAPDAYCAGGVCSKKKANGAPATTADECASGFLADGVCCDTVCNQQCEACDVGANSMGTCTPVVGQPRNGRPACDPGTPSAPCSAAECDGVHRTQCAGFVGSGVACRIASCTNGVETLAASCDGKGACPEEVSKMCEPYACGTKACKTSCTSDADCAADNSCNAASAKCVSGASCKDATSLVLVNGLTTDCSPYKCSGTKCLTTCTSVVDCAAPNVCDVSHHCVSSSSAAGNAGNSGGCALRPMGQSRSSPAWVYTLLGLLGIAVSRKRRGKRRRRRAAVTQAALLAILGLLAGCSPRDPARVVDRAPPQGEAPRAGSAAASYGVKARPSGGFEAVNASRRLRAVFESSGTVLKPIASVPWTMRIRTRRVGRAEQMRDIAPVEPSVRGTRVEYDHGGGIREWFDDGAGGLEQGFTIATRPPGAGPLRIEIGVSGDLEARATPDGARARFVTASGANVLSYGDASAIDAVGRLVSVRIEASPTALVLELDDRGARYPLRVDPYFTVQFEIGPTDLQPFDNFGNEVALDGDTFAAASFWANSAYVFVRTPSGWSQQAKFPEPSGISAFGRCLALSGDTLVIGADQVINNGGAAFVYVRNGSTWTLQQKIVPSDQQTGQFGWACSLSGDTAVIGSRDDRTGSGSGSAYVYVRSAGVWTLQQKLAPADGASRDNFGESVALDTDTVVIGSPYKTDGAVSSGGAAYVYVRSGTTWTLQQELTPPSPVAYDQLGYGVSIDKDTALAVGSAAWVFVRSGGVWTEQQKLLSCTSSSDSNPGTTAIFHSGSVSGDIAVIGDWADDDGQAVDGGSAWVFVRSGTTWTEQSKLVPADPVTDGNFGQSLQVSGDRVGVGAWQASLAGAYSGAAYVFESLELGAACKSASYCASGSCVDGVCCESACAGLCAACSYQKTGQPNGVCAPVKAGTDPDGECTDDGAPSCGQNGFCDGAYACQKYSGTSCTPLPCSLGKECTSGHCAKEPGASTGICCDQDCVGACRSCRAAIKGGGQDGVCGPIAAGTDPRDECPQDPGYPSSCGADGMCNGAGSCRAFALPTVACGATSCTAGSVSGLLCDGAGTCASAPATPCAPYTCDAAGTACLSTCTSDADCSGGAYCAGAACVPKKNNGQPAGAPNECESGQVSDGVCCNTACTGQCEACNQPGTAGTCTPVVGAPVAPRLACSGGTPSEPCKAAQCDGVTTNSCAGFVGSDTVCRAAACTAGVQTLQASCDGKGNCPAAVTKVCEPYVCGANACKTSCASDAECAAGNSCDTTTHKCSTGATCKDEHTLVSPSGLTTDCTPYRCADHACKTSCSSVLDCMQPTVCNAEHVCSAPPAVQSAGSQGSCAVTAPGGSSGGQGAWVLALLLLVSAEARVLSGRRSEPSGGRS